MAKETSEPTALEQAEERDAERRVSTQVRYRGTADERVIRAEDWVRAGVDPEKARTITWSRRNDFTVSREELDFLTDDQVVAVLRGDRSFVVEVPGQ